jgi:hypothetical protein
VAERPVSTTSNIWPKTPDNDATSSDASPQERRFNNRDSDNHIKHRQR